MKALLFGLKTEMGFKQFTAGSKSFISKDQNVHFSKNDSWFDVKLKSKFSFDFDTFQYFFLFLIYISVCLDIRWSRDQFI